jgi:hypothetical protein
MNMATRSRLNSHVLRLAAYFTLWSIASCYPVPQSNGTLPWNIINPGWASEPNTRGTLGIIWTCTVTIFACSWTVTHPSFPDVGNWPYDSKVWLCLVAILAPEILATWAWNDFCEVRWHTASIRKFGKGNWTLSQTYFVHMAGVHLKFNDCVETLGRHEEEDFDEETALEDLKRALHLDLIDISSIPVQQIQSRAKSSHIVKALVCFQAAWLVAQVLGRGIEKLPITSLEIVTVGYVFCALVTYSCWWHKAQDAEIPITIDCGNITKEEFCRQIRTVPADTKLFEWWEIISTCLILTTFGAIHCVA